MAGEARVAAAASSAALCGFTASTTAARRRSRPGLPVASATTVRSGPAMGALLPGAGSTATDGARPRSRQPDSMALPMRPQPTSRMGGMSPAGWSELLMPLPHIPASPPPAHRPAPCRPIARTGRREEALALRQCDVHHVLQAFRRRAGRAAQQYRVAEDRHAVLALQPEMAHPQLFVGECQQFIQGSPRRPAGTFRSNAQVKCMALISRDQFKSSA